MAILIDTSDYRLLKMPAAHSEAVLKGRGTRRAKLLQTAGQRIVDLLPKGAARAKVIATEVGISERTALGTNFSVLLDRLRYDLALKYVREKTTSALPRSTSCLATPTRAAFTLAFGRWTGKAPSELRQK